MIKKPKKMYSTVLSDSLSEFGDEEDEINEVTDSIDHFDLPLKAGILHEQNFSELLSDNDLWDGLPNGQPNNSNNGDNSITNATLTPSNQKKVRFEKDYEDGEQNIRKSGKVSVEDLLQNANEVNAYLGANIDKINSFTAENMNSRNSLYKIKSDANTIGTTRTESLSNFELSDYDMDTTTTGNSSFDNIEANIDKILHNENFTMSEENVYSSKDSGRSSSVEHLHGSDDTLGDPLDNTEEPMANLDFDEDTCKKAAHRYILVKESDTTGNGEDQNSSIEIELVPLLFDPATISQENSEISIEEAINNFEEVINIIHDLSSREDMLNSSSKDQNIYNNFTMKNVPSVDYHAFLERIQSKCMFGSIIYQTATYLFEILLVKRDETNNKLSLKHQLHRDEIHRMIIATIRIGTKLTEDFVHSHQYFCKVCGISKKLLNRLEVSLLNCLKHDRLMITNERLGASLFILQELRTYCSNSNDNNNNENPQ